MSLGGFLKASDQSVKCHRADSVREWLLNAPFADLAIHSSTLVSKNFLSTSTTRSQRLGQVPTTHDPRNFLLFLSLALNSLFSFCHAHADSMVLKRATKPTEVPTGCPQYLRSTMQCHLPCYLLPSDLRFLRDW